MFFKSLIFRILKVAVFFSILVVTFGLWQESISAGIFYASLLLGIINLL